MLLARSCKQTFPGVRELCSSGSLVFPALRELYPALRLGAGAADRGVAGDTRRPSSQKAFQGFPEMGGGLWSAQGALAGQMELQAPSSGLRFKKVLKPSIRSARHPHPSAKRDGSVTILKPSMNIACGSTYWSLPCMAAWAWFNVGLSGNASQGGIIGDQPFWCQQARGWGERQGASWGGLGWFKSLPQVFDPWKHTAHGFGTGTTLSACLEPWRERGQ